MAHDPGLCELVACERCDDYGAGYGRGKSAAQEELRARLLDAHAEPCGCWPCKLIKAVRR